MPAAAPTGNTSSMRRSSSAESRTCAAAAFSSRYFTRLVPGMGTTSPPCASTQASASCDAVHALLLRDGLHLAHQLQVLGEVLALKAGLAAAVVVFRQVLEPLESGPSGSRGPAGCTPRSRSPARGRCRGCRSPPRRASTATTPSAARRWDARRARGGWSPAAASLSPRKRTLPGRHQLGHGAHRVLDGHVGIDAVLVVQVDVVHAQPLQRRVARLPHVRRVAADAQELALVRRASCRTWSPAPRRRAGRAMARPTSFSLVNGPYMSAVSRKSIPSSSARWMVRMDSASSAAE